MRLQGARDRHVVNRKGSLRITSYRPSAMSAHRAITSLFKNRMTASSADIGGRPFTIAVATITSQRSLSATARADLGEPNEPVIRYGRVRPCMRAAASGRPGPAAEYGGLPTSGRSPTRSSSSSSATPGRAIAKADFCPHIQVDFGAAIRWLAIEGFAAAPLIDREWPSDLGPGGSGITRCRLPDVRRLRREQGSRAEQSSEAGNGDDRLHRSCHPSRPQCADRNARAPVSSGLTGSAPAVSATALA